MNGWLDWLKIAVIVVPAIGTGYVALHRIGIAEESAKVSYGLISDHDRRIATLEAERRAISESLAEIKQALRDLHNDLKTRR